MIIKPNQTYKLVEADGHLSVISADANLSQPHVPLILADKEKLCDYLMAYLSLRERGKSLKEAHNAAMEYVGITVVQH